MLPTHDILLPEYTLSTSESDLSSIGSKVDSVIKEHFSGKKVALRYLILQDHPDLTRDELIQIIEQTGTDKYDPNRPMSVAHDFYTEKGVGLFAVPVTVDENLNISNEVLHDFRIGTLEDRGYSLKIDLIVIYDAEQLESIPIEYDDGVGEDAFKFKHPAEKQKAVIGFITIS